MVESLASAMTAVAHPADVTGSGVSESVTTIRTEYVPASSKVKAGAFTVYWAELPVLADTRRRCVHDDSPRCVDDDDLHE